MHSNAGFLVDDEQRAHGFCVRVVTDPQMLHAVSWARASVSADSSGAARSSG